MKKVSLCTILVLCFVMLAGCKKKEIVINVDNVEANTVLVKNDSTVQAATVEAFDKSYYNLSELKDFITEEMNEYNTEAGAEAITLNALEQKGESAVLILNYATIQDYTAFNQVETTLETVASVQSGVVVIPDTFISAADGSVVTQDVILKNDKYRVLITNEGKDVVVDGSIKYYTSGVLVSESKLQTSAEEETVIIYKP